MWGTELVVERRKRREQFKNDFLGTARQAGYYDVDEAMSLITTHATGGVNGGRTRVMLAYAWNRLGVPLEQVCAAYGVNQDQVRQLGLHEWVMDDAQRAEIEKMVVELVPETPEPQRYVTAAQHVGALTTDRGAGRPSPPDVSPTGSLHFAR
jgi:hypothetical protein